MLKMSEHPAIEEKFMNHDFFHEIISMGWGMLKHMTSEERILFFETRGEEADANMAVHRRESSLRRRNDSQRIKVLLSIPPPFV